MDRRILCLGLTLSAVYGIFGGDVSKRNRPFEGFSSSKLIEQGLSVLAYSAHLAGCPVVGRENVYFCVFEETGKIVNILGLIPRKMSCPCATSDFLLCLGHGTGCCSR
jgi:hypothetical protein